MAWSYDKAQHRINDLAATAPIVEVTDFAESYYPAFQMRAENARRLGRSFDEKPLFSLPTTQAVIVDAVHIYANLIDFNDYLIWQGDENEKAHERSLNFLHLHYASCDRAVENCGAQRVDFHGSRMHAVVVEPAGPENTGIRVAKAIVLAEQLKRLSSDFANRLRGGDFTSEYRFGIDTGMCIAINGGRGSEPEPLFLGSAANHAAKLADGATAGTFLSDTAQQALANSGIQTQGNDFEALVDGRHVFRLNEDNVDSAFGRMQDGFRGAEDVMSEWLKDIQTNKSSLSANPATFVFHEHMLPLRTIDYKELMPSNSIRMQMISLFADLDGYTAYIDASMHNRQDAANAVRNLHIIRGELASVLHLDFEGRKVRFIGDCIHGLLASGIKKSVDVSDSVRLAIHCAGGMRSSFNICRDQLAGANVLGLAIGIELGATPVTRLGIRGDRSVRLSSSSAAIASEQEQRRADGFETAIGPGAYADGSQSARAFFGSGRIKSNVDYDDALHGVPPTLAAPATARSETEPQHRSHTRSRS